MLRRKFILKGIVNTKHIVSDVLYWVKKLMLVLVLTSFCLISNSVILHDSVDAAVYYYVYLPIVVNKSASASLNVPKMLGIMPKGYWGTTTNDVNTMLKSLDSWSGKKHSMVGWFFDIREGGPDFNFYGQLENLWVNGYTSFVNIGAGGLTAADIAQGRYNNYIDGIAKAYAKWTDLGGGRRAFIAPLQEMNGYWTTYGKDPTNFKLAYDVIRQRFSMAGISASEIWWVFAPNGWAEEGHDFEFYYPGDEKVDTIAFSSYNFGYCPVGDPRWRTWADYKIVYQPYIDRMRAMAPTKPIIISQGATSAQYPVAGSFDRAKKNQWIEDTYSYIASQPSVMGLIYFDMDLKEECDYAIYNGDYHYDGYKNAAMNQIFQYYSPEELSRLDLASRK